LLRTGEFFSIKMKLTGAKHRQNPRGKQCSAFHHWDINGRLIYLSEG
jgi:hypothetical protein